MTRIVIGLKDTPVENQDEIDLGMKRYGVALINFVINCETPLTVALQGDWGSGKTTLMKYIDRVVNDSHSQHSTRFANIKTIWFNTWQFSQFSLGNHLPILMLQHLIDELGGGGELAAIGKRIIKAAAIFGGAFLPGNHRTTDATSTAVDALFDENHNPTQFLTKLKAEMQSLVLKSVNGDSNGRVIVFVDDLDRLVPDKAVELLECIKNFFEVEGCVFVLACDYDVVLRGLRKRFGTENDEMGRRFFQKLIQLPFSMPVAQYEIKSYLKRLLAKMQIDEDERILPNYIELTRASIGFNPRSIKRLFNQLQLISFVTVDGNRIVHDKTDEFATPAEKHLILFAILCLQATFPALYKFFAHMNPRNFTDDLFVQKLSDPEKIRSDKYLQELVRELRLHGLESDDLHLERMCVFAEKLFASIKLNSDRRSKASQSLSDGEVETFFKILRMSTVVNSDEFGAEIPINERSENRRFGNRLARALNERYGENFVHFYFHKTGGFVSHQYRDANNPAIYVDMKFTGNWGPRIEFSSEQASFYLSSLKGMQEKVGEWVGSVLKPQLGHDSMSLKYDDVDHFVEFHTDLNQSFASMSHDERMEAFQEKAVQQLDVLMPLIQEFFASEDDDHTPAPHTANSE